MSTQNPNNKIVTVNTSKSLNLSRDVPMNLGVEQALLGAIISNNLAFEKIENFLRSDFFSTKINKIIFEALKRIISSDQIADINTLKIFLENNADFKENGGLTCMINRHEDKITEVADADLIVFGIPFIANPDFVFRLEHNLPLNEADSSTFYGGNEKGYTDYPFYQQS